MSLLATFCIVEGAFSKSTYLETDLDSGCCRDTAVTRRLPVFANPSVSRPFISDSSDTNTKTFHTLLSSSPISKPNKNAQSLDQNLSESYSRLRYRERPELLRDENRLSSESQTDALSRSGTSRGLGNVSGDRTTHSAHVPDVRRFDEDQELRFRTYTIQPRSNTNFGKSSGDLMTAEVNRWQTARTQEVGRSITPNAVLSSVAVTPVANPMRPSTSIDDAFQGSRYSASERLNVNPKPNLNRLYVPKV